MRAPSSFCTICTNACGRELFGFLLTLSLHHKDVPVFVTCDSETKAYIDECTPQPRLRITWNVSLDQYSNKTRYQMEQEKIWSDFQMEKANAIGDALTVHPDTLFIDCDTFILDRMFVDDTKQLGVSPQFIDDENVEKSGYYNGGMLWTNQRDLPNRWKEFTKTSRYYDQASIENLVKVYDTFEFDDSYNVHTWRFVVGKEDYTPMLRARDGKIYFGDRPVKFLHAHFNKDFHIEQISLFVDKMREAKMWRELLIVFRIRHGAWIMAIPKQPRRGMFNHVDDSFRELAVLFAEKNRDVEIVRVDADHCHLVPSVLLYDRPTIQWVNGAAVSFPMTLLGNGDIEVEGKMFTNGVRPWIFWPRRPSILEKCIERLPWDERTSESIFIGNFENNVQKRYRTTVDWSNSVSEYHCTSGSVHVFTQEEYLDRLKRSKFGLCIRGFGSKCHREVELMAMGTVPLITDHVTIHSYQEPPVENVHYVRVKTPEDLKQKVADISPEKWDEMSRACHDWYMRNVHSDRAWTTMIKNLLEQ